MECLILKDSNEYCKQLNVESGLAIYIKKHSEIDCDHSTEFDSGMTIGQSFSKIIEVLESNKMEYGMDYA